MALTPVAEAFAEMSSEASLIARLELETTYT
jgi:hypothetical protein